jgi:hypothetical protein
MTESQHISEMIAILIGKLEQDYQAGNFKRDAHPKNLGLLKAEFIIEPNLPSELQIGIFKEPKTYPAIIRSSNANGNIQSDKIRDFRGIAIKLIGVEGEKVATDEKFTQDFLLMTYPTMPLGTVKLFYDAVYYLIKIHPLAFVVKMLLTGKKDILQALETGKKHHTSPLDVRYWSTTPYQFGDKVVKYTLIPKNTYTSKLPTVLTDTYLTDNMQKHLESDKATFDFCVQFQKNETTMPIENAGIEWKESDSPFIKVATLVINHQHFNTHYRNQLAEDLSFSPSHSLHEHKPLGGINRARALIYKAISDFRHDKNNRTPFEPTIELYQNM